MLVQVLVHHVVVRVRLARNESLFVFQVADDGHPCATFKEGFGVEFRQNVCPSHRQFMRHRLVSERPECLVVNRQTPAEQLRTLFLKLLKRSISPEVTKQDRGKDCSDQNGEQHPPAHSCFSFRHLGWLRIQRIFRSRRRTIRSLAVTRPLGCVRGNHTLLLGGLLAPFRRFVQVSGGREGVGDDGVGFGQ